MRRVDDKGSEPSVLLGPLGSIGGAFIAAGMDLFGRSLEIGARHLRGAVVAATSLRDSRSTVDAFIEQYQQYIGEVALIPGIAAQTLRLAKDVAGRDRLLFAVKPEAFGFGICLQGIREGDLVSSAGNDPEWRKYLVSNHSTIERFRSELGFATDAHAVGWKCAYDFLDRITKLGDIVTQLTPLDGEVSVDGLWSDLLGEDASMVANTLRMLKTLSDLRENEVFDKVADEKEVIQKTAKSPPDVKVLQCVRDIQWAWDDEGLQIARLRHTQWLGQPAADVAGLRDLRNSLAGTQAGLMLELVGLAQGLCLQTNRDEFFRFLRLLEDYKGNAPDPLPEFRSLEENLRSIHGVLSALQGALVNKNKSALVTLFDIWARHSEGGALDRDRYTRVMQTKVMSADLAPVVEAFAAEGFRLSKDNLSIRGHSLEWRIVDHGNGRVFTAVQVQDKARLEVYGREEGRTYTLKSKDNCDLALTLPFRIHDARQGFVAYAVNKDSPLLTGLLQCGLNQSSDSFKLWDIGARRTPIIIFVIDCLGTDVGAYRELGIGCFVYPKDDPYGVGMHVLRYAVNDDDAVASGNRIWGYPKVKYDLDVSKDGESFVEFKLAKGGADLLRLTFPREGRNSSKHIPLFNYTLRNELCCRSVFTRSGDGEVVRTAGEGVSLTVEGEAADEILKTLKGLGISKASKPILSGWTERMSGELSAPIALSSGD